MDNLLDILIDLLPEFDLPEPDVFYTLIQGGRQVELVLAFPDLRIGIREGGARESYFIDNWQIWEYDSEERARYIFREIAKSLDIEPSVHRINFSRLDTLIDANQLDAAREELENLQNGLPQDHPDWDNCEGYRKKIRKARRKRRYEASVDKLKPIPTISFPALLRSDAARVSKGNMPDYCLFGFYSPEDESMSAVDAVWVATVSDSGIEVWPACLQGNPAYHADPMWETVATEVELLQGVLERIKGSNILVWDTHKIQLLLQNWHYRVKGTMFTKDYCLLDLKGICQIAFPTADRTDFPESLCKNINIEYTDKMGSGGPLAAMVLLMNSCAESFAAFSKEQHCAIRSILTLNIQTTAKDQNHGETVLDHYSGPSMPPEWLDVFFPLSLTEDRKQYSDIMLKYFQKLSPMVQKSKGSRDAHSYDIKDFLKKGGFLEQVANFPYHERSDQITFSQSIEDAFHEEKIYVLEAGTGIGKTIGYLVPTLLSGKRAYVSTHTKTLQDQAWDKDVPLVLAALSSAGIERTVAIIKGKANYVCLQTVAEMLETPEDYLYSYWDLFFAAALINWLLITKTGWLSELEHFGNSRLMRSLGRDQAPPKLQENWADTDPYGKAKDAASKADLVVANHSYVFALANSQDQDKNEFETLILDEAHNVDAVITEVLTKQFRPWPLLQEIESVLKRDDKGEIQGLYRALFKNSQVDKIPILKEFTASILAVVTALTEWCVSARKQLNEIYQHEHDLDPDIPKSFKLSDFWLKNKPLYDSTKDLLNRINELSTVINNLTAELETIKALPRRIPGSLSTLEEHLNENAEALKGFFEAREDTVHWAEASVKLDEFGKPIYEDGKIAWLIYLKSTPLDIIAWLQEKINPIYKHLFYLSATMSISGNFKPIIERFGLDAVSESRKVTTGVYSSPFDYQKQAMLGIPHNMPIADSRLKIDPLYMEQQSKHISSLAKVSNGRMLVLFTSRLLMREMQPRLRARLSESNFTIISQLDANRSALIERLREAPRKGEKIVLLGLRGLWEGIDVPGQALSVLVISRLPFEFHQHPVSQEKKRYYESKGFDRDYFREKVVPTVYLHLRQMYGRLIRSETDLGATIITDPRIYIRKYGKHLLQRLPLTTTVVDSDDNVVKAVSRFLAGEEIHSSFVWGELPLPALGLSPDQRAIVECPSYRILVRAAAGSGKTRVLIARIIRIIEGSLANPDDVLALTFTNKAMDVMRERLHQRLGVEHVLSMHDNVLTYHKLAMRIIRQDNREQKTETFFLDESNPELQEQFFEQAREASGLTIRSLNDEDARTMISYAQNGLVNETELKKMISEWSESQPSLAQYASFFLEYTRILRENNLIDYGEAIVKAVNILREKPQQTAKWSNRFKWIFCDEYQDTSPAQATLLQLLGQQANLFVVGDNAQSIYSWQGSDPDNLKRFELDFPDTATFSLSKNFRCFPKLVRMSSRFLEQTGQAYGLRMEYDQNRSTEEQSVYFFHNTNDKTEACAIAELAKQALDLKVPGDPPPVATVGILARKWHLLEEIEMQLLKEGIPYKFEGESARGITASPRIRFIINRAFDVYTRSQSDQDFGDTAEGKLAQKLRENTIQSVSALIKAIREIMPGDDLAGVDDRKFYQLCSILGSQDISAIENFVTDDKPKPYVALSSIHSQKGEEFDTVFVIGLESSNLPHEPPPAHDRLLEWRKAIQTLSHATWRAAHTRINLQRLYEEEEKRIYYVAMTRAKYNLIISRARMRNTFGISKQYKKSGYLDLSYDPKLVTETQVPYDILLSAPAGITSEDGYRTDGRVFQSNSGIYVRSKSEMLLANEFTSRGMFFEYEEPADNVMRALPDFTFPDYGNVILEHLGQLNDPYYLERWDKKAIEYEEKGIRYFRTDEEEIKHLTATVDRLQENFKAYADQQFGENRVILIDALETLRRTSKLNILKPLNAFEDGIFEVDHPEIIAFAFCKDDFPKETLSTDASSLNRPPEIKNINNQNISWSIKVYDAIKIWVAQKIIY